MSNVKDRPSADSRNARSTWDAIDNVLDALVSHLPPKKLAKARVSLEAHIARLESYQGLPANVTPIWQARNPGYDIKEDEIKRRADQAEMMRLLIGRAF